MLRQGGGLSSHHLFKRWTPLDSWSPTRLLSSLKSFSALFLVLRSPTSERSQRDRNRLRGLDEGRVTALMHARTQLHSCTVLTLCQLLLPAACKNGVM
jgi:hypothetical protein